MVGRGWGFCFSDSTLSQQFIGESLPTGDQFFSIAKAESSRQKLAIRRIPGATRLRAQTHTEYITERLREVRQKPFPPHAIIEPSTTFAVGRSKKTAQNKKRRSQYPATVIGITIIILLLGIGPIEMFLLLTQIYRTVAVGPTPILSTSTNTDLGDRLSCSAIAFSRHAF